MFIQIFAVFICELGNMFLTVFFLFAVVYIRNEKQKMKEVVVAKIYLAMFIYLRGRFLTISLHNTAYKFVLNTVIREFSALFVPV
jgi:hypothetical protein